MLCSTKSLLLICITCFICNYRQVINGKRLTRTSTSLSNGTTSSERVVKFTQTVSWVSHSASPLPQVRRGLVHARGQLYSCVSFDTPHRFLCDACVCTWHVRLRNAHVARPYRHCYAQKMIQFYAVWILNGCKNIYRRCFTQQCFHSSL